MNELRQVTLVQEYAASLNENASGAKSIIEQYLQAGSQPIPLFQLSTDWSHSYGIVLSLSPELDTRGIYDVAMAALQGSLLFHLSLAFKA